MEVNFTFGIIISYVKLEHVKSYVNFLRADLMYIENNL